MFSKLFFVFLGGGIGAILRYGTNSIINLYTIGQLGTLLVNVLGSFLFGILVSIGEQRNDSFNLFLIFFGEFSAIDIQVLYFILFF